MEKTETKGKKEFTQSYSVIEIGVVIETKDIKVIQLATNPDLLNFMSITNIVFFK